MINSYEAQRAPQKINNTIQPTLYPKGHFKNGVYFLYFKFTKNKIVQRYKNDYVAFLRFKNATIKPWDSAMIVVTSELLPFDPLKFYLKKCTFELSM